MQKIFQDTREHSPERSIVIVGVGLIGGSIAAAVRQRFPDCQVTGIGRSQARLQQAAEQGLLTAFSDRITPDTIPPHSLGIVCLPVHQIADSVRLLLKAGCEVITDAGSVKGAVYEGLGDDLNERFVGSHPIAGSEQSGFEHADPQLFANRLCIVTTTQPEDVVRPNVQRVMAFWKSLDSSVYLMSPEEHDRVLALTSHLPHIMASVTASCVAPEFLAFTGTGYRDTTRIAAGSASLWASILRTNAKYCLEGISEAQQQLEKFREALLAEESESLEALWETAAQSRRRLHQDRSERPSGTE